MTDEDAIKMAREAGLHIATDAHWMPIIGVEYAKRFAALAADAEREACALKAEEFLTEPESDWDGDFWNQAVERVAFAIRARKETK